MNLFGMFEKRGSVEDPQTPLTSSALLGALGGTPVEAGVRVNELTALHMPSVWRAVTLVSSLPASLPLHVYRHGKEKERVDSKLMRDPHPDLTPYELWRLAYTHRALWGNAYIQKIRNRAGQITELWPIRPDRVQVDRVDAEKLFTVTLDDKTTRVLTSRDILHIPGMGYDGITGCSPIRAAAEGIGLSLAAEKSASRLFGSGNMISGVLQTEQRLGPEQAAQLKAQWKAKVSGVSNAHDVAVLDSGASFSPVTMPFRDAQFLESRQFQVIEIARMFGVPLFLLMESEKSTSWGTGLEQQARGFVTFDLSPTWLTPTEQRVTKELLPGTQYARYAVQGLLRGDSEARAAWYTAMRNTGAFSANDIRELEEMTPLPEGMGGDTYIQPLNMAPLGSDPTDTPPDEGGSTHEGD